MDFEEIKLEDLKNFLSELGYSWSGLISENAEFFTTRNASLVDFLDLPKNRRDMCFDKPVYNKLQYIFVSDTNFHKIKYNLATKEWLVEKDLSVKWQKYLLKKYNQDYAYFLLWKYDQNLDKSIEVYKNNIKDLKNEMIKLKIDHISYIEKINKMKSEIKSYLLANNKENSEEIEK